MEKKKLAEMKKEVFTAYSRVRSARQSMGDIIDTLHFRDSNAEEFDKMWHQLNSMETNLEETLAHLSKEQ